MELGRSKYANGVSSWAMTAMKVMVYFVTTDARTVNINVTSFYR
jgi:hypothetical protein